MKRCMYCGHENEDSLVSCSVCGNKLGIAVPTQEPVTAEEVAGQESAGGEAVNAAEPEAAQSMDPVSEAQRAADEAMVTQEPAFAGQVPVNSQFGETAPAGQFNGGENTYASQDGQAAGHGAGTLPGEAFHQVEALAVITFSHAFRSGDKSCREHFRKHNQICRGNGQEDPFHLPAVGCGIRPDRIRL